MPMASTAEVIFRARHASLTLSLDPISLAVRQAT